jgi:hypothetical protein
MKLVECPICDSQFDIEKVPDGTKLKCGKCKKVFGVVEGGEMMPIFDESVKTAAPPAEEVVYTSDSGLIEIDKVAKGGYEEVVIKRRMPGARGRGGRPSTYREALAAQKPKPEPILYVGALVAIAAIISLFYIWSTISQPLTPPKPKSPKPPATERIKSGNEGSQDEKSGKSGEGTKSPEGQ